MENIIEIAVDEGVICSHEMTILTEHHPDFLLPVTIAEAGKYKALLYTYEGLLPISRCGTLANSLTIGHLFDYLCGYIRCLLLARDRLLNTRLLSSDPAHIFVAKLSDGASGCAVKGIWGFDTVSDEGEKVCRIADNLSSHERIIGAKISMERMTKIIRSERPSLKDCLKKAETLHGEWNQII